MADIQRLGFLTIGSYEEGKAFRAALLVTDLETKPIEFRCTSPIRPSELQKLLYGAALELYLKGTCLAEPLLAKCRDKPDVLFVNRPELLELRPNFDFPILLLSRHGEAAFGETEADSASFMITSETGRFDPVVVRPPAGHEEEAESVRAQLQDVFRRHDLLEPFERALRGLDHVQAEKVGE